MKGAIILLSLVFFLGFITGSLVCRFIFKKENRKLHNEMKALVKYAEGLLAQVKDIKRKQS